MRTYILTKPAVTGMGELPAGADISDLMPNERWALCQMGYAVAVLPKDLAKAKADLARKLKAQEDARAAKEAEDLAANIAANAPPPEAPEPELTPADEIPPEAL